MDDENEQNGYYDDDMASIFGQNSDSEPDIHQKAMELVSLEEYDGSYLDSSITTQLSSSPATLNPEGPSIIISSPLPLSNSSSDQFFILRLPRVLSIDNEAFNPSKSIESNSLGRVIRYRWITDQNGEKKLQSNAKFITWSDGSHQILVDNIYYNVTTQSLPNHQYQLCSLSKDEDQSIIIPQVSFSSRILIQPLYNDEGFKEQIETKIETQSAKRTFLVDEIVDMKTKKMLEKERNKNREKKQKKADRIERNRPSSPHLTSSFLEAGFGFSNMSRTIQEDEEEKGAQRLNALKTENQKRINIEENQKRKNKESPIEPEENQKRKNKESPIEPEENQKRKNIESPIEPEDSQKEHDLIIRPKKKILIDSDSE